MSASSGASPSGSPAKRSKPHAQQAAPSPKAPPSSLSTPWARHSFISTENVSVEACEVLFAKADELRDKIENRKQVLKNAEGKILALCFLEPSTRTMCSFSAAMQRMGGGVLNITPSDSSVAKGETLQDTIKCLSCYADAIVLRHPVKGSTKLAAEAVDIPLISAGDGVGEHPTQALLDLYTILREQPSPLPETLHVTFLGDAKNGRTVHSLARLLTTYLSKRVHISYVCPVQSLRMPRELFDELSRLGLSQSEHDSLDADVVQSTDVLYVTRVQKERFESADDYLKAKGTFVVNPALMTRLKPTCTVMHPLPRVDEIDVQVDSDPRAAYFRQMKNGLYVRMALLGLVLDIV